MKTIVEDIKIISVKCQSSKIITTEEKINKQYKEIQKISGNQKKMGKV